MKALSVKQPWAGLIAIGMKGIETRTWSTAYRGSLLIVASKKPQWEFMTGITQKECLIFGQAICIVDLVDCRPMTQADEEIACCPIYSGAFSWVIKNSRPVRPFEVKGQLGLFNVELPEDFDFNTKSTKGHEENV
jgi:hypothetical protein